MKTEETKAATVQSDIFTPGGVNKAGHMFLNKIQETRKTV